MASTNKERWKRYQQRRREGIVACVVLPVDGVVLARLQRCDRVPEDYTPSELSEANRNITFAWGFEAG